MERGVYEIGKNQFGADEDRTFFFVMGLYEISDSFWGEFEGAIDSLYVGFDVVFFAERVDILFNLFDTESICLQSPPRADRAASTGSGFVATVVAQHAVEIFFRAFQVQGERCLASLAGEDVSTVLAEYRSRVPLPSS